MAHARLEQQRRAEMKKRRAQHERRRRGFPGAQVPVRFFWGQGHRSSMAGVPTAAPAVERSVKPRSISPDSQTSGPPVRSSMSFAPGLPLPDVECQTAEGTLYHALTTDDRIVVLKRWAQRWSWHFVAGHRTGGSGTWLDVERLIR